LKKVECVRPKAPAGAIGRLAGIGGFGFDVSSVGAGSVGAGSGDFGSDGAGDGVGSGGAGVDADSVGSGFDGFDSSGAVDSGCDCLGGEDSRSLTSDSSLGVRSSVSR